MIPVLQRSILLAALPGVLAAADTSGTADQPLSVFCRLQQKLGEITSLRATLHRTQTFRSVRREARGTLQFDRTSGALYQWKSPGRYSFVATDTLLCGIDLTRKCGWKNRGVSRQQIDPLFRLLSLQQVDSSAITYRGNTDDNELFFSIKTTDSTTCTIGLATAVPRVRIIETFTTNGRLLEKAVFDYEKQSPTSIVPSAIIITGLVGSELSVDTIRIDRQQYNKKVDPGDFAIPEGIKWNRECINNIESHWGK